MKNIKLLTIIFLFSSFLVGCGMKGPLYQTKTAERDASTIETAQQQTSTLNSSIIDNNEAMNSNEPLAGTVEKSTQNTEQAVIDNVVNTTTDTQLMNQATQIPDYLFTTEAQLSRIPNTYYTIQLAALDSEESLQNFVKQHNLPQKGVYLYKTTHNNNQRYIIIYGEYETRKLAQVASESLPATFADIKTWVKQYKLVQQDLSANQ